MQQVGLEALEQEVKAVVSKVIEVDAATVESTAHLVNDLGADSMMVLEIMAALDKKYGINIPEAEIPKLTSVQEIAQIVRKLLGHA